VRMKPSQTENRENSTKPKAGLISSKSGVKKNKESFMGAGGTKGGKSREEMCWGVIYSSRKEKEEKTRSAHEIYLMGGTRWQEGGEVRVAKQ